jgi:Fe-coproporphyrin III synthase
MMPIVSSMPILVLYPHRRCNCRCVMCDIWKDRSEQEISFDVLQRHMEDIRKLNVRWIVFSGGEPLMHSDLFRLTALIRSAGIRVTILTTGLLLEANARQIAENVDDVIVSLDGPPTVHDQVRRVSGAFLRLQAGVAALHECDPCFSVSARTTIQRLNHSYIRETARTAREIGFRSISFLAADISSEAFHRTKALDVVGQSKLALDQEQVEELRAQFSGLLTDWHGTGFVAENEGKLERIIRHFQSHLQRNEPIAPRCNAPWVSAVLESDGTVLPCFFQRPIGSVAQDRSLLEVLNGPEAVEFRSSLNVSTNSICKRCVCSLNWTGQA